MPHFEFAKSSHSSGNGECVYRGSPAENPWPHPHPSLYPHVMQRAQAIVIPSITTTPEQVPAR
ncbi:hypothetical protein [Streptomyces sp. NPDC005303]|uniref:hypothetical protein n=1 Tax=Streptomyces sp. NPDC005303 TaxID=3155713 RepID=UPI0033A17851